MLASRGLTFLKAVKQASKINCGKILQQTRNSHDCVYRLPAPPVPKKTMIASEILGGIAWWWILYHLWHDFDHIVGEFDYPDPSKWTDAELGIPPDDDNV